MGRFATARRQSAQAITFLGIHRWSFRNRDDQGQRVRGVREATGAQTGALSTLRQALVTAKERSLVRCRTCPSNVNEDLLADLREWRTEKVSELIAERGSAIPAYVVATDATLEALAEQQPTSEEELAAIPGLGFAKLAAHGEALLVLLDRHR